MRIYAHTHTDTHAHTHRERKKKRKRIGTQKRGKWKTHYIFELFKCPRIVSDGAIKYITASHKNVISVGKCDYKNLSVYDIRKQFAN